MAIGTTSEFASAESAAPETAARVLQRSGADQLHLPGPTGRASRGRVGRSEGGTGSALASDPLLHWTMLIALVVMWGSSFALTKVAVSAIAPESVVAGRLVIAGGVLFGLLLITGRRVPTEGRLWVFFMAMAVLGNCLPYWLISWGQRSVDSGVAGILMAVMPLVTIVLAHFFVKGDRMTWRKGAGFLVGFLGVVVLMGPDALLQVQGQGSQIVAQLAIVAGAVCYAVNTIIARLCPANDSIVAATSTTIGANLLFLPTTVGDFMPVVWDLDLSSLLVIVVLGVVSTALAPLVYFDLVRRAGPSFLSQINYLIPLWAVLTGMIFLGETPDWSAVAGMGLILAGIAVAQIVLPRQRRDRKAAA